jgi:hypothetical protein
MSVREFFRYLSAHDPSRELGLQLAEVCQTRRTDMQIPQSERPR